MILFSLFLLLRALLLLAHQTKEIDGSINERLRGIAWVFNAAAPRAGRLFSLLLFSSF
jgi:hypothetical protein